ncbi:MAG: pyruvate:ferredoxin (flavodoxin) oxidoreductase [Planctomycetota bacterium]
MSQRRVRMMDGNEAVASVAHRLNEVIAIYPITPSSPMGELADEWSAQGRKNIYGAVPEVVQMQSEAGVAGAVHGALQSGALTTTFSSSQGLLLMIPNLYKIAGELNAFAMHVAARSVATHALSIFGDHSDVMACRQTGLAMLCSASGQEAHDFAAVAHAATLRSRIPFLHFFDGFRTSHELSRVEELSDDDLRAMIDEELVRQHRARSLTPDRPVVRGTAQNPDVFFQAREAANPFYLHCPDIVQAEFDAFAQRTGRAYRLFDYVGHAQAERVVVAMGSGAETVQEAVEFLVANGERVGVLKVRLYRPFSLAHFLDQLPRSVRSIAVLDRTKEPGAIGEPLYQDVVAALHRARQDGQAQFAAEPLVIGGRFGLSSKEFTPAMALAVFEELCRARPKDQFTVGIVDDVTHTSLPVDADFDLEPGDVMRAVFFGLGADGTVGANKNSIQIIGEQTDNHAQGYFVYDSKKSGAVTISHLRFGTRPIRAHYLIRKANFVACHQFDFLDRFDVLEYAAPNAVFLLNAPYPSDAVWAELPREVQEAICEKHLRCYVIDAVNVAREVGMGGRINTVMQTCFFAISGVLPRDQAITKIKSAVEKTYGKKGQELVRQNFAAIDRTLANLHELAVPEHVTATRTRPPIVSSDAPDFVQRVTAVMLANHGDLLPVSAFPVDGTWPTATTRWEKRNIAVDIPVWDAALCIQCNKCALVCPHATIRAKVYPEQQLVRAPATFKSADYRGLEFKGQKYTIQVAAEDCTGCSLCVAVCPAKDKANPRHKAIDMQPQRPRREVERENYRFFLELPEAERAAIKLDNKGTQFLTPLFEYSGACAGCGETPYLKLMTQLFGDRVLVANATGCSSIYGGNLPTTPYTVNRAGRGPAWANSLFEDNAEFGLGLRLAVDSQERQAKLLLEMLAPSIGDVLVRNLLAADQSSEAGVVAQRERVRALRNMLAGVSTIAARRLDAIADYLVQKSVWIVGGDGWAYDIGFGGLDHVFSLGRNVNILVLDTEVYSNTGGQQSKATPLGAAAKFAVAGKATPKKDLGLIAMSYGNVYVARVSLLAKDSQTVQAFREAESFPGTSLIIASSPCIAHGYDLALSGEQQKRAVDCGSWPLYRFDPRRVESGTAPLVLDSGPPKSRVRDYAQNEARFRMVERLDPKRFQLLMDQAQRLATQRFAVYEQLSHVTIPT